MRPVIDAQHFEHDAHDDPAARYDRPSKSQRKRDSDALQNLGKELLELSAERLAKIAMSDNLRTALREAQRMTKHEARRRQLQYIGKLMRSEDITPIRAALDALAGVSNAENRRLHQLERLREQLLDDETAALNAITATHPHADLQHLRQLRRNALKEKEQNKPPRAYREIFQVLKTLLETDTNVADEQAANAQEEA
jgi:ribosome-associated protein